MWSVFGHGGHVDGSELSRSVTNAVVSVLLSGARAMLWAPLARLNEPQYSGTWAVTP